MSVKDIAERLYYSLIRPKLTKQTIEDYRVLEKLRKKFSNQSRNIPGKISVFGWDIEYVDGLSAVSCLDVLVIKRWNNFVCNSGCPVILDCGANIGISVLNYKRQFPDSRITAFEPDPEVIPILKRNLQRNGASDVQVIEAAVWTDNGQMDFFCEGADGSRLVDPRSPLPKSTSVRTIRLSDFICGPINMLKMDIEGAEFQVMPSLSEKLEAISQMAIECHIDNRNVEPFSVLLKILSEKKYITTINSYGPWRDLTHSSVKLPAEFDQYILLTARKE
jgi:FkbM family methyltransferase